MVRAAQVGLNGTNQVFQENSVTITNGALSRTSLHSARDQGMSRRACLALRTHTRRPAHFANGSRAMHEPVLVKLINEFLAKSIA